MSSSHLRKEVLGCFKALHRARKQIFNGDERALQAGRTKINDEFRKYKSVTNESSIEELVKHAKAVEEELRTTVIQAVEVKPGLYKANIRPETVKVTNVPYKNTA